MVAYSVSSGMSNSAMLCLAVAALSWQQLDEIIVILLEIVDKFREIFFHLSADYVFDFTACALSGGVDYLAHSIIHWIHLSIFLRHLLIFITTFLSVYMHSEHL